MIVQCPQCPARLNVPFPRPENAPPVQCPRCQAVFHPTAEEPSHDAQPRAPRSSERTQSRRGERPQPKFPYLLVGGVVLALAGVLGVVFAFSGGDKPKPVAANPEPPPPKKTDPAPKKTTPRPPITPPKPQIPAEYAELFAASVPNRPAPTVFVPTLERVGRDEISVPPFVEKTEMPADGGKMTLEDIKKATTYIKVAAGAVRGSGSGFVVQADRDQVLVATNHHVISPRSATPADGPPKVTVVFESGEPGEWERPGDVVASEPELDLAIVRVARVQRLPKPILPALAQQPVELMEIRICGFPFGDAAWLGNRNPNITIGKGTVSSIRKNDSGTIGQVQLDGSMNPGNSGGPVLDAEGRLVGVAVATSREAAASGWRFPLMNWRRCWRGDFNPARCCRWVRKVGRRHSSSSRRSWTHSAR
ncbi:MAG: trypsin-like peptidase domain-containing protein [Gemmataceae bacterium]